MTSVEKLMIELYDNGLLVHNDNNILDELLEKAKEEHKKEIVDAVNTFALSSSKSLKDVLKKYNLLNTGELYYEKTFKN